MTPNRAARRARPARKSRGIALIIALFTVLAVLVMGVTFIGLALNESKASASHAESRMASRFADAGLQYIINLMGNPASWEDRGVGYETLVPHPDSGGFQWFGVKLGVDTSFDTSLGVYVSTMKTLENLVIVTGERMGAWEITVRPVVNPGQPTSYYIIVLATISTPEGGVVSRRQIEARAREQTAADYAVFEQNWRAWDVPGAPPPNANNGTDDAIGIVDGYRLNGDARADGATPGDPASSTAGNFNIWGKDVRFNGHTSIQQASNQVVAGVETSQVFAGGLEASVASKGLPDPSGYLSTRANPGRSPDLMGTAEKSAYESPGQRAWLNIPDSEIDNSPGSSMPGIPTVKISITKQAGHDTSTVTVQKFHRYTNPTVPYYTDSFDIGQVSNGVIYVKGGNVQVEGSVAGQLTVVADENIDRGIYDATITAPRYDSATAQWKYPPPPANVEREGNLTIRGDITYSGGGANCVGLVSKNYLYLNDFSNKNALNVNGVLMSFDHSLQYDWDNFSRNPHGDTLRNGTFNFRGSLISKFADVEGDLTGKGYLTQQVSFDENLRETQPPFMPRWKKTSSQSVLNYVVTVIADRSALGTSPSQ